MASDFILDSDENGEFCVIPLGGKGNFFTKIDVNDFENIGRYKWSVWSGSHCKTKYAVRTAQKKDGKRPTIWMHRQILGLKTKGVFTDHVNGDGLNNRRFNLRVASNAQNQWNRQSAGGASHYKGVCWHVRHRKWCVSIRYHGKRIWIGLFPSEIVDGVDIGEIAAAKAYDEAARKYFGVFACLNCPEKKITAYKISEKDEKKVIKLIGECKADTVTETSEILSNREVGELELMCKYLGCNISQLAGEIVGGLF